MLSEYNLQKLKEAFNLTLSDKTTGLLNRWHELFLEYNSHTNLMSANDTQKLFEKHIFDSLAILKWDEFDPNRTQKILDAGTGGGFPSVILAICFPQLEIVANDSRIKKINFIIDIKDKLNIENLKISYARVEDLEPLQCDIVTSRAVGSIKNVTRLTKKHLKAGGHFVFYKAKTYEQELEEMGNINAKVLPYNLPTKEEHKRCLVIIRN